MTNSSGSSPSRAEAFATEGSQLICDLLYSEKTHFVASERLRRVDLLLGVAGAAASTAAAATVFGGNVVVPAVLALVGAVSAAIGTVMKADEQAQQHLAAGRELGRVRVELRHLMNLDLGHTPETEVRRRLGELSGRKADIDASAPGTSERQFRRAQRKVQRGDFDDD